MKYLKIQQNLLKMADLRDGWKNKPFDAHWFQAEGRVWVCFDGVVCLGIPHHQFYLDREQVFKKPPFEGGKKLIDMSIYAADVTDTKTVMQAEIKHKKMKLHKFTNDDTAIFINEDYMKYFDSPDTRVTGTKKNLPLYFWEDDELVGIVFPISLEKAYEW